MKTNIKWYGWIPDRPDHRDLAFKPKPLVAGLPAYVNLTPQMPPVFDQGDMGSCTANAMAAASQFLWMQLGHHRTSSRNFIYYNARMIGGTPDYDSGATLRDTIKGVSDYGECHAINWPTRQRTMAVQPPDPLYQAASYHKVMTYRRVSQDINDTRAVLASGFPFVFGFTVFDSFESDEVAVTGIVPMPRRNDSPLGGHAVVAVGYDDTKKWFIVRNSWGEDWGDKGNFYLPYKYLLNNNLADDLWVVTNEP